jgi:hypothetical protein
MQEGVSFLARFLITILIILKIFQYFFLLFVGKDDEISDKSPCEDSYLEIHTENLKIYLHG